MSRVSRHKKQSINALVVILAVLVVLILFVKVFDKGSKKQATVVNKPAKTESKTTAVIGEENNDNNKNLNENSSKDTNSDEEKTAKNSSESGSSKEDSNKSKNTKNKVSVSSDKTNSNSKTNSNTKKNTSSTSSNKETYLAKLSKYEQEDKKHLSGMWKKGENSEYNSYSFWDEKLNDLYGELKQKLPKERVNVLKKSQIKWINNKEEYAKKLAVKKSGKKAGISDYAEITKERCYFLVNNYIKD